MNFEGYGLSAAADESVPWYTQILTTAKESIPALVQAQAQKKILALQLKRAQQGLPPLKTEDITPTMKIQAGASPELLRELRQGAANIALPLAIGAGALVLFFVMKKRRGR
jgi:hypothetical protein